ncbi:RHS repeat protein [Chitinolyticbacter meiyuanensis]|uniref:RHS repeat protein n=1 Tax=Chitinolyticbacter meiyuanensis TaxID=682798 RepID=UPI00165232AB|nr:RHS repeat protein [Chitinolyticbacter meiyuanensis]
MAQLADSKPDGLRAAYVLNPPAQVDYFRVERSDGSSVAFDSSGNPLNASSAGQYRLTIQADGYTLHDGHAVERYDAAGRIMTRTDSNGRVLNFSYSSLGLLDQVQDGLGRKLQFAYSSSRLTAVIANGVHWIKYAYNAQGMLASVTYPDQTTRQYHYEDPNPYLLTGITDEAGLRYATWRYNANGEAISSEHAGGIDKVTLAFSQSGTTRTTEETDPLGSVRRYRFTQSGKRWLLTGKDQPGGAGCDPASSALGYDTNGNIKTRTDFNGVTTSYVYELSRNLETSRTEAGGTPQARTITTSWHPTFRLPATITEPGRVTEFTYDPTKGLLTQKKVTADGVSRSESWSYFPNGLLQTATDARGKVTHYTYDAQGNLATVTDPVGLVTQFTSYDPHGNVLTQIAPNGVTTTFTYDLRQRLKTRTTGGELTQFAYKPTGLLEKVTFPDQSWLQYRYDPAHRLIGIDHSNGSRIDYSVIDNAGNIKREDRYDPAGVLAAAQQAATQAQSVPNSSVSQ